MGVFFTLSPCAKNRDGTYRDLYWSAEDKSADAPIFQLKDYRSIDLFAFHDALPDYTGIKFDELWWVQIERASEFLEADLDQIPSGFLRDPREIKSDILSFRNEIAMNNDKLAGYDHLLIDPSSGNSGAFEAELLYVLTSRGFQYFYCNFLGEVFFRTCEVKYSAAAGGLTISTVGESVSVEECVSILCYHLKDGSDAEIRHALKRKEKDDTPDTLSVVRRDFYSHFRPYLDEMEAVCNDAIANGHLLIAGHI